MKTRSTFLFFLILFTAMNSFAQVQVFLHQPPPGQLNIADLWKFEIINNNEVDLYVKFHATVNSDEEGLVFEGTSTAYELSAMFSGLVSFPELEPFDMAYVNEEIKEILLRTGTVPAGVYEVCLEVINIESSESLFRDCIDQEVVLSSPPVLLYPIDGASLMEEIPVFSWMEPAPPVDGMTYRIQISEILADQSPEQALISNPPYLLTDNISGNFFEFPLSARPMETGRSYVWRITGMILGRPLLESEYASFIKGDPSGAIGEIELTFPPNGDVIDPAKSVFCWKPVHGDGVVYNVIVSEGECDTVAASDRPHPFPYLGADADAARADSLRRAIENYDIPYWRALCEKLRENIDVARTNRSTFQEQQSQFEEWAREIGCELTRPDCHMPECCPDGDCCAGLDPNDPADRAEFQRRLSCLTNTMRNLNETMNDLTEDFEWLINRWEEGEDHRNTMGAYDDIFGAFEYLLSMEWLDDLKDEIFDTLGITEMMENMRNFVLTQICAGLQYSDEECDSFIEKLNDLEQLLNDVKEGKESIETLKDALNAFKTGGDMPMEIFLKLMENLYATAGEATGVAVEGWDNFWREMCSTLQRIYNLNICIQELNEQIAQLEEDCSEFCQQAESSLEDEARQAEAELQRIRQERHENWLRDSTEFNDDLDNAAGEIANQLSGNGICCQDQNSGTMVFTFPPYGSGDPCKDYIFNLLSQSLGDRLCYFNIRIEINCRSRDVNFEWESTNGFQRNEDCCPTEPQEESIGRTEGNPGDDEICFPHGQDESDPAREGMDTDGPGRWRVEAERDGRVVARSSSRDFRTAPREREVPPPDTIPIPRTPVQSCNCAVKVSIGGHALPPGVGMIVETGTALNLAMEGSCSGTCTSANQSLSVWQPALVFTGMTWLFPPFRAKGDRMKYKFETAGTYKVIAKQQCSDGSECEAVAIIEVKDPVKSKINPRSVKMLNTDGAKCGNSKCMHPFYFMDQNQFIIQGNEIEFEITGEHKIGYISECFPDCSKDKDIEWQIREPSGNQEILSGTNLFEIKYNFDQSGVYTICIVENVNCTDGAKQDSKFLEVKVLK